MGPRESLGSSDKLQPEADILMRLAAAAMHPIL